MFSVKEVSVFECTYVCIAAGFVSFKSPLLGSGKEELESWSPHKWEGCKHTIRLKHEQLQPVSCTRKDDELEKDSGMKKKTQNTHFFGLEVLY